MNRDDDFSVDVPEPLSHWYGKREIHKDNAELLAKKAILLRQYETIGCLQFWKKDELKAAEKQLDKLNDTLLTQGIQTFLEQLKALNEEIQSIRVLMFNTKQEYGRSQDGASQNELLSKAETLKENMRGIQRDRQILLKKLRPHRDTIRQRDELAARIQEHYAAVAEERENSKRDSDMDREARLIEQRIILAITKLGFYHKKTRRDMFGKAIEIKQYCRFQEIWTTPDKIHLKLDVSRLGLTGSHVDNMPHGVYAQDVVSEKVLTHLSTALELPIDSPNLTGEATWSDGAWMRVDRLGINDGLPEKILYKTAMKRYPEAKRHLIPVPMGVKAGRKINWVYLVNEPHMMINGVTGFGKSNSIQMFLATVVQKQSPDEAKFLITDMKNTGDFRQFISLPHVIEYSYEPEDVHSATWRLWMEMKRRQNIIGQISNNITQYNGFVADEDKMPHIFYIFDEYPSVNINRKIANEVHSYTAQIAMQGRAVGIHMIISGQQSYKDDFPRQLLANMTIRFTARQNNVSGAMSTTGSREAMKIANIKGRFLCTSNERAYQVQMPFIEDEDIEAACDMARRWPEPRPFALPAIPGDEDEMEIYRDKSPEELILEAAFTKLDGTLKARQIWEVLNGAVSQPKTTEIVKRLSAQNEIEWEGKLYSPTPEKKYYRLIEIEEAEEAIEPGESDEMTELATA